MRARLGVQAVPLLSGGVEVLEVEGTLEGMLDEAEATVGALEKAYW
eukprot:CAMPEP_0114175422 /NCGR_PEP_ID=MMETSP0043_2-20121206/36955_1 /TAXON_ID=464988 /ORGANISM="Hemiselmis andersenii, Strain CCMP644" /LENGTH=45 /DNA_ID= /DNA_START= /DNA_END= /DNA_ORIENTATION=